MPRIDGKMVYPNAQQLAADPLYNQLLDIAEEISKSITVEQLDEQLDELALGSEPSPTGAKLVLSLPDTDSSVQLVGSGNIKILNLSPTSISISTDETKGFVAADGLPPGTSADAVGFTFSDGGTYDTGLYSAAAGEVDLIADGQIVARGTSAEGLEVLHGLKSRTDLVLKATASELPDIVWQDSAGGEQHRISSAADAINLVVNGTTVLQASPAALVSKQDTVFKASGSFLPNLIWQDSSGTEKHRIVPYQAGDDELYYRKDGNSATDSKLWHSSAVTTGSVGVPGSSEVGEWIRFPNGFTIQTGRVRLNGGVGGTGSTQYDFGGTLLFPRAFASSWDGNSTGRPHIVFGGLEIGSSEIRVFGQIAYTVPNSTGCSVFARNNTDALVPPSFVGFILASYIAYGFS